MEGEKYEGRQFSVTKKHASGERKNIRVWEWEGQRAGAIRRAKIIPSAKKISEWEGWKGVKKERERAVEENIAA